MKHKAKLILRYFVLNELDNVVEDNFSSTFEVTRRREIGL